MGYSARTGRHPWWPPNVKTRLAAIFFPAPGDADRHALAPAARALEDELVHLELDRHGVFAGKAGGAEAVLRLLHGAHEALDRQVDALVAHALVGLNKGASDVAVLDETLGVRDTGLMRVPDRGRRGGVRHANNQVGIHRRLARQLAAHVHAHRVEQLAADHAVGAGEVDVLEDAEGVAL